MDVGFPGLKKKTDWKDRRAPLFKNKRAGNQLYFFFLEKKERQREEIVLFDLPSGTTMWWWIWWENHQEYADRGCNCSSSSSARKAREN